MRLAVAGECVCVVADVSALPSITQLQRALELAENYSIPVFPCDHTPVEKDGLWTADKSPIGDCVPHGFHDATLNLSEIERWWTKYPRALIGVPTGAASNLFVIDVDPLGEIYYSGNPGLFGTGRVHKTNRGHHLVYRHPGNLGTTAKKWHPARGRCNQDTGFDTRGDGGYIIWWPAEGLAEIGGMEDIGPLPEILLSSLREYQSTRSNNRSSDPNGGIDGDRSADLLRRVGKDVRVGRADYEIMRDHLGHPHAQDQTDPVRSVQRAIDKARSDAGPPKTRSAAQPAPLTLTTSVDADLAFVDLCDMHAHLLDTYVIKNFLPSNAEAWVLGMPGSGKTFLVTDMALHVANNLPWMGHKVKGGLVVYVGAENARSVERRFTGARDAKPEFKKNAPLVLTPGPVDLKQDGSIEAIMRCVRAAELRHGQKCVLVIVDTLSRAGGGKEDTEDFGACLRGCGRLKLELQTSVMLVHHLGKDPTRGGRGWSGMNGGVDLEVLVTEEGDLKIAIITKARDGQEGERIGFSLEVINLGQDIDSEILTTCVVRSTNAPVPESKRPSGKHQVAILAEAELVTLENPSMVWTQTELLEMCNGLEISRGSARKAILNLRELGYFQPTIGGTKLAYHPQGKKGK